MAVTHSKGRKQSHTELQVDTVLTYLTHSLALCRSGLPDTVAHRVTAVFRPLRVAFVRYEVASEQKMKSSAGANSRYDGRCHSSQDDCDRGSGSAVSDCDARLSSQPLSQSTASTDCRVSTEEARYFVAAPSYAASCCAELCWLTSLLLPTH
jgi:hypothetical protein